MGSHIVRGIVKIMALLNYMERQLIARLDIEANVTFVYRKSDMSLRVAHGTRNLEYVPQYQWPKQGTQSSTSVITYYDHDKKDWRSLRIGSLLEIR